MEKQAQYLIRESLIEPLSGAWSSSVILVRKKDQSCRLCINYQRLNNITKSNANPLPRIDDSLDALTGSVCFSTSTTELSQDAQENVGFITWESLWTWKVLQFGLTSAATTFETLMERVFKGQQWKSLLLYIDDIIVYSSDF